MSEFSSSSPTSNAFGFNVEPQNARSAINCITRVQYHRFPTRLMELSLRLPAGNPAEPTSTDPLGISMWVFNPRGNPKDIRAWTYAHQQMASHCKGPLNCCYSEDPRNSSTNPEDYNLFWDQNDNENTLFHANVTPAQPVSLEDMNRIAMCENDAVWQRCFPELKVVAASLEGSSDAEKATPAQAILPGEINHITESNDNDLHYSCFPQGVDEEIDLPDDDADKWLQMVLYFLNFVVCDHTDPNLKFTAALLEYLLCSDALLYQDNPLDLIQAYDGLVAKLVYSGILIRNQLFPNI